VLKGEIMSDNFAPRPVANAQIREINLTGYLFPWQEDATWAAPVLMKLDGTNDFFLPLFSTLEKLHHMATLTAFDTSAIKRIDDGDEFLKSIPKELPTGQRLRIMIDPYRADDKKTRFTEVIK
jgi:hypothetical protein